MSDYTFVHDSAGRRCWTPSHTHLHFQPYSVPMTVEWVTPVGERLTRDVRMALYGGAKYGGIETSTTSSNVFIYSDPVSGETYGYHYDGWSPDGSVFLYTGEGRVGDQLLKAGNRAIAEHADNGSALRLFIARGTVGLTNTKIHEYVGEFEVDPDQPYVLEEAPDQSGDLRTVFVFRLRPVGTVSHDTSDSSHAASAVAGVPRAELIPVEATVAAGFDVPGAPPSTASRVESALVGRYVAHIEREGHSARRWRLLPEGEMRPLFTDVYDEQSKELCEAKGTATRHAVRTAIGQLFDYRRHIPVDGLKLALLLPHRPSDDLLDLVTGLGIACIYEDPSGGFTRE